MRIKRLFHFLAILLTAALSSNGQVINSGQARKMVERNFPDILSIQAGKGEKGLNEKVINDQGDVPALYIFNDGKGGFLILSAEKNTIPVLGWSESSGLNENESEWPASLQELVNNWVEQIEYIRKNRIEGGPEIIELWRKLEEGNEIRIDDTKDVAPLVATRWNQTCGYNSQCPVDSKGPCGRAVTGCVATAMAQVIRHNAHPVKGTATKCYTHSKYGELCADFSAGSYNYSNMPNTSGNADVAKLIYHCGVAVSMNYGPGSSGAYSSSVANAMRSYFDYTNGLIISKGGYSEDNWSRILKRELENNRPLYYSGSGTSGHAFVLDGYKSTNHFHVNWGWGGSYDGYFYLNSLNPGSMSFTSGQQAIAGMIPTTDFTGLDFSNVVDITCKTPIAASLSGGTDYVNYYGNTYPATFGRELVYRFTTTFPGRLRVKVTGQTESVYTFLLNYPDKDSLIGYGTNGVTVDDKNPGIYYLVIEGINGNEPDFVLEVVCPTEDADLDISAASVTPGYVQSLQPNVSLSANVRNIGNSDSGPCSMEFYLSKDAMLDTLSDTFLEDAVIPELDKGESAAVNSSVTIPDGLLPGFYYVIFVADRKNIIPETDEETLYSINVTVPDSGKMDCSSSVTISDGNWYHGNTLHPGSFKLEKYLMAWEMTGPEVIHSFTPLFNGVVKITFIDKSPGSLYAIILPVCNENTAETSLRIYNMTDTLTSGEFYAVAGNQYFIVVDGQNGASGDYSLLVNLPKECPVVNLKYWGKLDLCEGDQWPGFSTFWGYRNYQWYKDSELIPDAVSSSYTSSSPGIYHLEITENGCTGVSSKLTVRMDPRPDTAVISTTDELVFCNGGFATLTLSNIVSCPVNWARNNEMIEGETGNIYRAAESGEYTLKTINGACAISSENNIVVTVLPPSVDIGKELPLPSDVIVFYYPFTRDNNDISGKKNMMMGWDYEPVNDRDDRFWQARYLRGEDEILYSSNYDTIPENFTLGFWFKTTTTAGGVMAGFYDNPWSPSKIDALLYISDDGKIHYWLSNGLTPVELSSSAAYNDDKWHFAAISHGNVMVLDIDNGKEKVISPTEVTKEKYKGYWTFGGPSLPASVAAMPGSIFFKGAIDDIILLGEINSFVSPYMVLQPELSVVCRDDPADLCIPGFITWDIPFSQPGIEYRLWNKTQSLYAPVSAIGTGGTVTIGGEDLSFGTNEFTITAKVISTGCEMVLDTTLIFNILSFCTNLPENQETGNLKVYPVPARDIIYFDSPDIITEVRLSDIHGRIVYKGNPGCNIFEIDINGLPESVYYYFLNTESGRMLTGKIIVL